MNAPHSVSAPGVCVYCGSSPGKRTAYHEAAQRLGTLLGQTGYKLVYGGGHLGMMGTVADAALAAGAIVIGIIPGHLKEKEQAFTDLPHFEVVPDMHTRKNRMENVSDAFVILPGGLGTMDEFFEILTWRQLELHHKPVIVVNVEGYWDPLLRLLDHMVAEGYVRAAHRDLVAVVDSVDAVMPLLPPARQPAAHTPGVA